VFTVIDADGTTTKSFPTTDGTFAAYGAMAEWASEHAAARDTFVTVVSPIGITFTVPNPYNYR
jgi:hypothetical protein